jgi:hypothetical protein
VETCVLHAPLGYGATAIAERDGVRWIVADYEVSKEDVANWVEFYVLSDRLTEMSEHGTGTQPRSVI